MGLIFRLIIAKKSTSRARFEKSEIDKSRKIHFYAPVALILLQENDGSRNRVSFCRPFLQKTQQNQISECDKQIIGEFISKSDIDSIFIIELKKGQMRSNLNQGSWGSNHGSELQKAHPWPGRVARCRPIPVPSHPLIVAIGKNLRTNCLISDDLEIFENFYSNLSSCDYC